MKLRTRLVAANIGATILMLVLREMLSGSMSYEDLVWMNASVISHEHAVAVGRMLFIAPPAILLILCWWIAGQWKQPPHRNWLAEQILKITDRR